MGEIGVDGLFGGGREGGDAFGGAVFCGERNGVADFAAGAGRVAIFFGGGAGVESGGGAEIAEGGHENFVAATGNPVDNFGLGHKIEVAFREKIGSEHGFEEVSDKLHGGTGGGVVVFGEEGKSGDDKISGDFGIVEAELVEVLFVFEDAEVGVIFLDFGEVEIMVEEEAVAESVLEAIGGKAGKVIIGDGIEVIVGDFAGENIVAFELASDNLGVLDNFGGAVFGGLLSFVIAVEKIDAMFETG